MVTDILLCVLSAYAISPLLDLFSILTLHMMLRWFLRVRPDALMVLVANYRLSLVLEG
jgi:hypothetical protein